ncbi:hypothetical protein KW782_00205 [Candidatus Parcubacteria bacterium]|nr:hypothetical protein [Candidatus Parcubacteria bacterium]
MATRTFGEFFDTVEKWVLENRASTCRVFLDEWVSLVSPADWQEARAMAFSEGLFNGFWSDMVGYYRERLQSICTDALYERTTDEGHRFLRWLTLEIRSYGLTIPVEKIDTHLSPSDAIAQHEIRRIARSN